MYTYVCTYLHVHMHELCFYVATFLQDVRLLPRKFCLPFLIFITGKRETEVLKDIRDRQQIQVFLLSFFPVKKFLSENYVAGSLAVQNLE